MVHGQTKSTSNVQKPNSTGNAQRTRAGLNLADGCTPKNPVCPTPIWSWAATKNKFNLFLTALHSYPRPFLQPLHTHMEDETIFCRSSPSSSSHTSTKDLFTLSQGHIINILPLMRAVSLLIVTGEYENHCLCASWFSSCQIFFRAN